MIVSNSFSNIDINQNPSPSNKKSIKRFADSVILHELKQPDAKFILLALSALFEKFEVGISPDEFKSILDHGKHRDGVIFSNEISQDAETFKNHLLNTYDSLLDSYVNKQSKFIDSFIDDVNELLNERDDPDLFCLRDGDNLKVEDSSSVYG